MSDVIYYAPEFYQRAVKIVREDKRPSTSYLQRTMQIGFSLASALIERMENEGIVTLANHLGKREVITPDNPNQRREL